MRTGHHVSSTRTSSRGKAPPLPSRDKIADVGRKPTAAQVEAWAQKFAAHCLKENLCPGTTGAYRHFTDTEGAPDTDLTFADVTTRAQEIFYAAWSPQA